MNENLRNLNRSVAPDPGSLSQCGFAPNTAVEWALGMGCTNMKADGVATSKSNFPKNFGPQRNLVHGRGKGKMFSEEQRPCFPPAGTRRYTSHGPRTHANAGGSWLNSPSWCSKFNRKHDERSCSGTTNHCFRCKETGHVKRVVTMYGAEATESDSMTRCGMYGEKVNESQRSYALTGVCRNPKYQGSKPTVGGFQPDISSMCSKCGRKHAGTICPGSGNGCFHCKEKGHIKRYCPRLTQNVNVEEVGRPSTTGQLSQYFGLGRVHPNLCAGGGVDVYVSSVRWWLISFVGLSVDMRYDVLVGFNPGKWTSGQQIVLCITSRLSERFSLERERITWEGEILGYTGRFSPERGLPRLGEKWQTGAVDTVRFSLERESLA
ncbi:hypothetical protein Lal_00032252 [Lupinus albus]|nr:hypothetical protein Lal_00032252 [Lupinus albus]